LCISPPPETSLHRGEGAALPLHQGSQGTAKLGSGRPAASTRVPPPNLQP
jgi:hypothetical protein